MSRPKLHNQKRSTKGRPGAASAVKAEEVVEESTPQTTPSSANDASLNSFLQAKRKIEKEPVRTISFRMPESMFQSFESMRGQMNRTEFLLSLIEYADRSQENSAH